MQTNFTLAQLADPDIRDADGILRACVHCGFCTATCPTYVLLGDELDGPRGRIYLIKDMLENDRPATAEVVKHIDRCLSCRDTCPSGPGPVEPVSMRPAESAEGESSCSEVVRNRYWHHRSTTRRFGCCPATASKWCSQKGKPVAVHSSITWAASSTR